MKIEQRQFTPEVGWSAATGSLDAAQASLVLVFGGCAALEQETGLADLRALYPGARLVLGSTSGGIAGQEVVDDRLVATAVAFAEASVQCACVSLDSPADSYGAGRCLAGRLGRGGLRHVFIVSDGQRVNGSALVQGLNDVLSPGVTLTGGMSDDGVSFERTVVGLDARPTPGAVVAIGFYGESLEIGVGSAGGWQTFGPERIVTRSEGNVLHELDGKSALRLYCDYLGDSIAQLPGSALRFPLAVTLPGTEIVLVRTILSIDEARSTMTFAGDIPQGARVRLMHASFEDLIDGAAAAAELAHASQGSQLVLCVSCVGRRLVLGQRVEEETETVHAAFGPGVAMAGFYSHGELAPPRAGTACQLHNQTMTITALRER